MTMTQKFTPESLRARSQAANKGFASKAEAERHDRLERQFQNALAFFEKDAAEASLKGRTSAIGGEFVLGDRSSKLDSEDQQVWTRLKEHYESLGFKTRAHGPYTDGGPSKCYNGLDLLVDWS